MKEIPMTSATTRWATNSSHTWQPIQTHKRSSSLLPGRKSTISADVSDILRITSSFKMSPCLINSYIYFGLFCICGGWPVWLPWGLIEYRRITNKSRVIPESVHMHSNKNLVPFYFRRIAHITELIHFRCFSCSIEKLRIKYSYIHGSSVILT